MDIAGLWRSLRANPGEAPGPGAEQLPTPTPLTLTVTQQCQLALPVQFFKPDEVTVTVKSTRPGKPAEVTIAANFNSADGSYQGPTTTVGQGQFTATSSEVTARFVVMPATGWPVLGVGAVAKWQDGAPDGVALTYQELACDPFVWWGWLIRVLAVLTRPFSARGPASR